MRESMNVIVDLQPSIISCKPFLQNFKVIGKFINTSSVRLNASFLLCIYYGFDIKSFPITLKLYINHQRELHMKFNSLVSEKKVEQKVMEDCKSI